MLPTILPCLQTLRFDFYLAVSRRGIVYYMRMILNVKMEIMYVYRDSCRNKFLPKSGDKLVKNRFKAY